MNLTFVCQACDESFDFDYPALVDESRGIKCPNCKKRLPATEVDELVSSIDELAEKLIALRKRFSITIEMDAEDLPALFENARDEEEDDDEDEEEDDEVEELTLGGGEDEERY